MAMDMSPGRVRVNSISPTWTWTPEVKAAKPEGSKDLLFMVF